MVSWIWVLVAFIIGVAIGAAVSVYAEKRRVARVRTQFGPEYDRVAREHGPRGAVEELAQRERRVAALDIRDLTPQERERFAGEWRLEQAHFVDDPRASVAGADHLVGELMRTRGYPVADFDQRAADVSVNHPRVVEYYRAAHNIALRDRQGQASTEDLRNAMVNYRALFEELLGSRVRTAGGS